MSRRRAAAVSALLGCALLAACAGDPAPGAAPSGSVSGGGALDAKGCATDYVAGKDYFPDKSTLKYAKNFTVDYHGSYQVLTVKQSYEKGPAQKYVLYRCGTPAPAASGDLQGAPQIQVPVRSVYSGSTTHLPMFAEIDRIDDVTGVAGAAFVSNADVRRRVQEKKVVDYAPKQAIDTELVVAGKPDVLMTAGVDDPAYATLRKSGVPVMANAEWLEPTPLGRAEWVKYVAALTGDEAKAAKVFDQVDADYTKVKQAAASSGRPVSVLPGQMFSGTWSMPAGDSYVAALLKDANATYPWSGTHGSVTVPLSLEDVLAKGRNAQVWLMSAPVQTLADVAKSDPRYAEFAAYRSGAVWSNNAKVGPGGGNDYFETGVARPDLVLADLVTILHPKAAPGHSLEFYRQVTK